MSSNFENTVLALRDHREGLARHTDETDVRFKSAQNRADLSTADVLIIDDDPVVREQLERLYVQSGYAVSAFSSAEAGLRRDTPIGGHCRWPAGVNISRGAADAGRP